MANTTIAALGPHIAVSAGGEIRVPGLADGTAKAGNVVSIVSAAGATCGDVVMSDIGASELFVGILEERYDTAIDTAPTDGVLVNVIVPQKGHIYRVRIEDPAGTEAVGQPYGFSDTVGTLEGLAALNTAQAVAYLAKAVANTDTVAEVRWA